MGIKMDEEGVGSCLLPLQCQVQQASAEWGQGPSEAGGGEELKQVWPQDITHPVHSGADQVERAYADCPDAVGWDILGVRVQLGGNKAKVQWGGQVHQAGQQEHRCDQA